MNSPKSKVGNQINILMPWKEGPLWIFDDDSVGLWGEAFVPSASELIDKLVEFFKTKPGHDGKIALLFSSDPFPDAVKLNFIEGDHCGVTYKWKKQEAWLCPAFFCYFDPLEIPKELWVLTV